MVKIQSSKNPIMEKLLTSLSKKTLSFSKGSEIEGKVILKTPSELILDLESKSEGYIPAQNIPTDVLDHIKLDDKLVCIVVDPENEQGQVILTLSRPQTSNFNNLSQKYKKGEIYKGKVTKSNQIGVFVELEPGLEGLIKAQSLKPEVGIEVGQEISVNLDAIDTDKQRISLYPVLTTTKGLIYK